MAVNGNQKGKRRKSSTSPTQRTNAALKKSGATYQVVERFNSHAGKHGVRVDLFGVIDIIALIEADGYDRIFGIQCTAGSGSSRMRKAEQEPRLKRWLASGGVFEVWGWRKLKAGWRVKRRRAEMTGGEIEWHEVENGG